MAALGRLVICPLIFVGGALMMGFRGIALAGLFLVFASPTATSSYPGQEWVETGSWPD